MALLTCPDCKGPVSDQAVACPKCGRPVEKAPEPTPEPEPEPPQEPEKCRKCGSVLVEPIDWERWETFRDLLPPRQGPVKDDPVLKRVLEASQARARATGVCAGCRSALLAEERRMSERWQPLRMIVVALLAIAAPAVFLLTDMFAFDVTWLDKGPLRFDALLTIAWYFWCVVWGWRYLRDF